jgi:PAS domain S-box-containing protein
MTVIDLAVVALALLTFRSASAGGFFRRRSRGRALLLAGVGAYALFFSADLVLLHFGAALLGPERGAALLEVLRSGVVFAVALVGVGFTVAGFLATSRSESRDARRLSLMTDALPLAVAYVDRKGRFQFVNRRYAALHQRAPEEVIGRYVRDVIPTELYEFVRINHARALLGEPQTYEHHTRLGLEGKRHDLHVDLVPEVGGDSTVMGFFLLVLDVTSRVELEREVVRAGEAERLSVARDLHDGLGQALTGVSLALGALARKLGHEGSSHVATVNQLTATAQRTIEQARQYTHLLAPTLEGGLFTALRSLATEVSALYEVECELRCHCVSPASVAIGQSAALHFYRIAQESVNNAARHGRAGTITIDCRVDGPQFVLEVVDDGLGIPPAETRTDGMGIKSMFYRARMIGGLLQIDAAPGGGTRVACSAPLAALRAEAPAARDPAPFQETSAVGSAGA